jgi:peptidoglycan/xylan/chitin deacetylase (PgdA/CDA1 family)
VTSREQRRREIEARRRLVRRQRRGLAAALLAVVAAVAVLALSLGGGDGSAGKVAGPPSPRPPKPRPRRPSPVDKVLGYTDYVLKGTARRREVALTFDDGPSPFTPRIVKVLRRRHAPATFFPIGQSINEYGRYLKLVRRRGFPIGDHTYTHPLMGRLPRADQVREIDQQAGLLKHAGVHYPRLFRPPYGSFDEDTRALLHERRMLMVLWNVNPQDYYRPGAAAITARVLAGVRPGSIVLMHDGGGDRSQTVAALPGIIRKLRARGYRLVTVSRLLADDPPPRHQGPPPNLAGV